MKKNITLLVFLLFSLFIFSQNMRTEKYELYLLKLEENEVNISKGMYMTQKKQYYYEGVIEVLYLDSGETKEYAFFFSLWDDKYIEFLIKDSNNNSIGQRVYFEDKEIAYVKKNTENISIKLKDNSNIDNSILSSMIVWLDNSVTM